MKKDPQGPQQILADDSLLHRDDSHLDFARNYLKCDGIFVLTFIRNEYIRFCCHTCY